MYMHIDQGSQVSIAFVYIVFLFSFFCLHCSMDLYVIYWLGYGVTLLDGAVVHDFFGELGSSTYAWTVSKVTDLMHSS